MSSIIWTREDAWIHRWTVFTAVCTFILLVSGGLVTSHGVGMSVPDWPNTFGYNMFTFPISHWIGGIFYEHTHRLIASAIGFSVVILNALLWSWETKGNQKPGNVISIIFIFALAALALIGIVAAMLSMNIEKLWVFALVVSPLLVVAVWGLWKFICNPTAFRWLGIAALAGVVLQGLLGGLRVELYKDEIGIFHGILAQTFFCGITLMAVITSRAYREKRWAEYEPHSNIRYWVLGATLLIFLQLGVAATMRHEHIGLSIPDFPLAYGQVIPDTSAAAVAKINAERVERGQVATNAVQIWIQMVHRFIAVLIATLVAVIWAKSRQTTRGSQKWATIWMAMILVQICLGAWTIWSNKAADIATLHMALGALSLIVGAVFTLRLFGGARTQDFAWPDAPKRPMMGVS